MSPQPLQLVHVDPTVAPADGDVPVYDAVSELYIPTAGVNGNVTAAGTLTSNQVVIGQGTKAVATLGTLGTTTTVLHGNAAGAPTFATVVEADITLADNTTNNSSTAKHGFLKKLDNNANNFMNGQGDWATPAGAGNVSTGVTLTSNAIVLGAGTTNIGIMGSLGTTTTLLHGNAAGAPTFGAVVEADITLADNTTNDVSTSAHGFMPKLPSGVPGVLLGFTRYLPGTQQALTTTSATMADIDASNLIVTFTAPASGNVIVRISAAANISTNAQNYYWGLRESSSNIANSGGHLTSNTDLTFFSMPIYVTGLTPGNSYSYKWSHSVTGGATGQVVIHNGQTNRPPATMEVWAA